MAEEVISTTGFNVMEINAAQLSFGILNNFLYLWEPTNIPPIPKIWLVPNLHLGRKV